MFCPNCGNQVVDGSARCSQCGEMFASIGSNGPIAVGGGFKGFLILLISFFTMPFRTLKVTLHQLREIGGKGSLKVEETEIPHLTWLGVAGHFVVSIVIILIVLAGIVSGLKSLGKLKDSVTEAIGGLILYPLGGIFAAIFADWIVMIFLELLLLHVVMTNYSKQISNKLSNK